MDTQTIDREYGQLQSQAQQTVSEIKTLADKLRAANLAGSQDAREWMLDLKEIALAIQAEQNQVNALLQALHGFVARQAEQVASAPQQPPSPGAARRNPQKVECWGAIIRNNREAGSAGSSATS